MGFAQGFQAGASMIKSKDERKLLQQQGKLFEAQAGLASARASQVDTQTKQLEEAYNQLHMQTTLLQNQLAAKDLEQATDALITNGNYEEFNKVLKTNPVIAQKMMNNYGVKSIRPIDWNNVQDITELKKAGLDDESIKLAMNDPEAREGISKAFYMTDAGHLTSLDDFLKQTGYLERATSEKFKSYVDFKNQLANIGKKLTVGDVEAKSAEKWLQENPDKTWVDWENMKKSGSKQTITRGSLIDEYANFQSRLARGEKLTPEEEARMKVLKNYAESDSDEKRDILVKGMDITRKYQNKLFDQDISDEDVVNAKLYAQQAGIKPDSKENREFKDQFNILKQGKRLVTDVNKLSDEEIARGMLDTGLQKLKTWLADGKKPDEKMLKSINMQTKLGKFLAAYIKSISGTAVAEQEYARLSNLFGGDVWTNTATLKEAVNTFVGELDKEFRDKADTSLLDNPATTLDLVNKYKRSFGPNKFKLDTKQYEGFRPGIYDDATGKMVKDISEVKGNPTIGYGHKLTDEEIKSGKYRNGITKEEAEKLYELDKAKHSKLLYDQYPFAKEQPAPVQEVLKDMAFNMGVGENQGLGEFKKFLAAVKAGDYKTAAAEIRNSKYAKDTKGRAEKNAKLLESIQPVINPKTGKPSKHYVGEIVPYQGVKYRIIDEAGNMEEVK